MSRVTFNKLYKIAKHVRNDFVSLGKNVNKLDTMESYQEFADIVSQIKKEDFCIDDSFFAQNRVTQYSSCTLFETKNNDICFGLFILPKGYYIPMHDHPSMFIVTKILHGTARKVSYNIVDRQDIKHQFLFPQKVAQNKAAGIPYQNLEKPKIQIKKQFDNVISEGILDVVRPEVGNLHEFLATEGQDFIFLNCFIPHYDDKVRFTNFYEIEDEHSDITNGILQYGPPESYKKKVFQLDFSEMPFFKDNLPLIKGNEDCKLEQFLNQQNYDNKLNEHKVYCETTEYKPTVFNQEASI